MPKIFSLKALLKLVACLLTAQWKTGRDMATNYMMVAIRNVPMRAKPGDQSPPPKGGQARKRNMLRRPLLFRMLHCNIGSITGRSSDGSRKHHSDCA